MTPPPLFIIYIVVPLTRSSGLTCVSNCVFFSSEMLSATAMVQLPRSARDIHCPANQRPFCPSGPLTSTLSSMVLLSDDQDQAWHLPHQYGAPSWKNCGEPAMFSKPVPVSAPITFAAASRAWPGVLARGAV